jgi:hypothetical protein
VGTKRKEGCFSYLTIVGGPRDETDPIGYRMGRPDGEEASHELPGISRVQDFGAQLNHEGGTLKGVTTLRVSFGS